MLRGLAPTPDGVPVIYEHDSLSRACTEDATGGDLAPGPPTQPGSVQRSASPLPAPGARGRSFTGSPDRWSARAAAMPPAPPEQVAWDYGDPVCNWLG